MKKRFVTVSLLFVSMYGYSQIPEDALRHSWNMPSGTARNQAIGGANVSLGGDMTSVFLNPAGIGLYKTGEIILTPGISFYNGKGNYRGTDGTKADGLTRFSLGTSGIVWGSVNNRKKWNTSTFSIAVNKVANFNNTIRYKGQNDFSSFTTGPKDNFTNYYNQFKTPGVSDDEFIKKAIDDASLSYNTRMSLSTFLVDVDPNNHKVYSRPEDVIDFNKNPLNQENTLITKGGITELAFAYAAAKMDKLYIGGSLGVPIINYKSHREYWETDAASQKNDSTFNYMTYDEDYKSSGVGFNLKLGAIYKVSQSFRLGLAIHTPTYFALNDDYNATMTSDVGLVYLVYKESINNLNKGLNQSDKYNLRSPARFMLSGTYMFGGGEENVTKQKGFITADVEYINHGWSRFSSAGDGYDNDAQYFKDVNNTVKNIYKGCVNAKVGGEIKLNTFMIRGGFAYYGNPYKDKSNLKADMMNISGGLGYRNKGIFVDLTYVQSITKDVNFPYLINSGPNTFATTKGSNGNVVATVGFKF